MPVEVLAIIIAAASLFVALGGGLFVGFAWVLRRMDEGFRQAETRINLRFDQVDRQFDKVNEKFGKVYVEFGKVREELHEVRTDLTEVKISVPRLEGPQPRLILPS